VKKILITFFLAIITMAAHAVDSVSMFVGEIKILEVGSIERVAVGNGGLLSTSMLENGQLLLLAEKEGETTVHIWYSDGAESDLKVQIVTNDNARVLQELRTLLSDLSEVEVKQVGERIFITGSLLTSDNELLGTIKTAYPQLIDLTRKFDPPASALVLPSQKMIYMNVKITEFNTTKLTELGVNWADFINGPSAGLIGDGVRNDSFNVRSDTDLLPNIGALAGIPSAIGSPLGYLGIASEITSRINLLVQTGDAVILAEPKLSSRSGGKAEFLAGGEIPVISAAGLGSTNVEYKEFGIKLEIEPVVDSLDNIMARVATEVSAVDQSNAVDGVPAFITRKTSTDISMKDNETLVLSGLVDRSFGNSIDKFPLLGDIPILGALFRSTRWNNNLTELVIFVTPTVYDAKSEINQERVQRREKLIEQFKTNTKKDDLIID
jgi:pilus assembly protein CpaC